MGIRLTFWEETPERVEYYLTNHQWQSRSNLGLRSYDMGKSWTVFHSLICPPEKAHSFPENFIENGTRLPNYEFAEMYKGDEYALELTSPFLFSVEETRTISTFLDSLDRDTIRNHCTREFWIANGFSGEYTSEKEEDGFRALYFEFEKFQLFFHRTVSDKHCVIGRKS